MIILPAYVTERLMPGVVVVHEGSWMDIDENGVDRAQIRAMLALTPEERLQRVQEFVESALEIRAANANGPIR